MKTMLRTAALVISACGLSITCTAADPAPGTSAQTPTPTPTPAPAPATAPAITLIAKGTIPADALDESGMSDMLNDRFPAARLGAFGSAIAYTGVGNRFIAVADRGPLDGAVQYKCRFHELDLSWDIPTAPEATGKPAIGTVSWKVVSTQTLRDDENRTHIGWYGALTPEGPLSDRLDPEAVRVSPSGKTLFISDEYGPHVRVYDRATGIEISRFNIPDRFTPEKPTADQRSELPPTNTRGREPNRGFEGLAISPDGTTLFAMLQSPLMQDGSITVNKEGEPSKRKGSNIRILRLDVKTGAATGEFVYQLGSHNDGVCELLALTDTRFLVLERDNKGGSEAKTKRLYEIDLAGATDVSTVARLPTKDLPDDIKPVSKKLFLDMLDPKLGLAGPNGEGIPEKWEALTFGPNLPDGRRTLVVASDNDFRDDQPSYIWVFAW